MSASDLRTGSVRDGACCMRAVKSVEPPHFRVSHTQNTILRYQPWCVRNIKHVGVLRALEELICHFRLPRCTHPRAMLAEQHSEAHCAL